MFGFNKNKKEKRGHAVANITQGTNALLGDYHGNLLSIPSVFASVQLISNTIASLPIDAYIEDVISKNLPIGSDLSEPIENMSQSVWVNTIIRNLLLDGNAYAVITKSDYTIYASNQVILNVDNNGDIVNYTVASLTAGSVTIAPEQMLHFKRITRDGRGQIGLSLIELFVNLFDEMKNTSSHTNEYMKNGLLNGLWIEITGRVQPDKLEEFREMFAEIYGGLRNRNKIPTFTDGTKLHTIDNKPLKDSDISNLKMAQLKDIAMIFNIPISLLDGSQGNYGSTVEANLMYMKTCIAPIIRNIEDEINLKINVLNGVKFKFDTSKFLAGTFSQQVDTLGTAVDKGILTPNEARERLGYKTATDGDKLYAPAGTPTAKEM